MYCNHPVYLYVFVLVCLLGCVSACSVFGLPVVDAQQTTLHASSIVQGVRLPFLIAFVLVCQGWEDPGGWRPCQPAAPVVPGEQTADASGADATSRPDRAPTGVRTR